MTRCLVGVGRYGYTQLLTTILSYQSLRPHSSTAYGAASHNIPYHTIPYHTIPYHTIPYHTIPYHTIPYHTIPYHTIPYRTIPYHTIPYHTIPYHTIPYHTIPYHTIPYHTIPYHTIPYHPYHTIPYHTIPYHTIPYHTTHNARLRAVPVADCCLRSCRAIFINRVQPGLWYSLRQSAPCYWKLEHARSVRSQHGVATNKQLWCVVRHTGQCRLPGTHTERRQRRPRCSRDNPASGSILHTPSVCILCEVAFSHFCIFAFSTSDRRVCK